MELKLGKMTSKEIAKWMDITYNTYKKNISSRLEKLKHFCKFEPCYGGVIIEEIYIPEYIKNFSHDDKIYLEEVKATGNGISSLSGITRNLMTFNKEFENVSENTVYHRMKEAGIRTFGPTSNEEGKCGPYGRREYLWAIKIDNYNHYRTMDADERKVYDELKHAYCSSDEVADKIEKLALLQNAKDDGEIDKIEKVQEDIAKNFYKQVIKKFKDITGEILVRATWHDIFETRSAFGEPQEKIEENE